MANTLLANDKTLTSKQISKIVAELQEKTQKAKAGELELGEVDEHDFSLG